MGMIRRRFRGGSTSVPQNYNTIVFHTYILYNDREHYEKDNKDDIKKMSVTKKTKDKKKIIILVRRSVQEEEISCVITIF